MLPLVALFVTIAQCGGHSGNLTGIVHFNINHDLVKLVADIEIVYLSNHLNCHYIQHWGVLSGT